jgi:DNA-binding transcriptional LysR family regulator
MRVRQIEVFNAIFLKGTVSAAAEYLNITQPTASKILNHAESQLGFNLFTRVKGRLIPTSEGKLIYAETKEIIDKVESLKKTTQNIRLADAGDIRISVIAALGLDLIPKAVVSYRKLNPKVNFEIQTRHYDNILASLIEHEKDVGIAFHPPKEPGINYLDLGEGEFVCIYANGEFDDHPERIKLENLIGYDFIGMNNSGPLADLLKEYCSPDNKFNNVITAQTYFLALNLVALGGGISIVDEFTARSTPINPVKYKRFNPPLKFSIKAMHIEHEVLSNSCEKFLQYFKDEFLKKL